VGRLRGPCRGGRGAGSEGTTAHPPARSFRISDFEFSPTRDCHPEGASNASELRDLWGEQQCDTAQGHRSLRSNLRSSVGMTHQKGAARRGPWGAGGAWDAGWPCLGEQGRPPARSFRISDFGFSSQAPAVGPAAPQHRGVLVVQASRLHDSTDFEEVRAGRPHHKGRRSEWRQYNALRKEAR